MDRIQLYEGYEDPTNFFRSSVRTMLVGIPVGYICAPLLQIEYSYMKGMKILQTSSDQVLELCW
jgi:hypothetical protein